jgi:hypothetical protein
MQRQKPFAAWAELKQRYSMLIKINQTFDLLKDPTIRERIIVRDGCRSTGYNGLTVKTVVKAEAEYQD